MLHGLFSRDEAQNTRGTVARAINAAIQYSTSGTSSKESFRAHAHNILT